METRKLIFTLLNVAACFLFVSCGGSTQNEASTLSEAVKTAQVSDQYAKGSYMTATLDGKPWEAKDVSGGSFMNQTNVAGHVEDTHAISVVAMMENLELNKAYEIKEGAQSGVSAVMISYIDGEKVFNAKSGNVKFTRKNEDEISGNFEGVLTDFNGTEKMVKNGKFSLKMK